MNRNRILCLLLLPVLLLSMLPVGVLAQESEFFYIESPVVQGTRTRSTVQGPSLASGRYADYIDRLATLPDYALDLYRWLEDNATAAGALADPTLGTEKDGNYGYLARQFTGSETFTFTSVDGMKATAKEIAQGAFKTAFDSYMAYAGAIYNAFDRDHPEVFWLSGSSYYSYSGKYSYRYSGNTCTVTYQADMMFWLSYGDFDIRDVDYDSVRSIARGIELREAKVEEILEGCTAQTPWEQVKYLNAALTSRNAYNSAVAAGNNAQTSEDAWECISALEGREGNDGPVCEGYARAFKVLCDRMGIPCVLVNGTARSSLSDSWGAHMWNYVQLDGGWYAVDVTWNDPVVSGASNGKVSGYETEKWLLVGSDTVMTGSMTFAQSRSVTNSMSQSGVQFTNEPLLEKGQYVYREPHRHTEQTVSGYAATCTQAGLTNGKICSECGEVLTAQTVIPATGHSLRTVAGYAATCTQAGLTEGRVCSKCDEVVTAQTVIPATGHSLQTISGYAATCTEDGLTDGEACSVCEEVVTAQTVIPATGHSPRKVDGYEPSCTLDGCTDGEVCSCCGEVLTAQTVIPATGHSLQTVPGYAATCTEDGLTDGEACSVCEEVVTAQTVLPASGHSYETTVTEPTATEQGYTTYTCTACGDSYVSDYVEALGLTLTGSLTAYADGDATIELIAHGETVATAAVTGKTGSYSFEGIAPGSYILKISKEKHVTREYTVIIADENVTWDVKICLLGDVTGDGRVNIGDVVRLYAYIRGSIEITDEYALACANVNGGRLNIGDAVALYGYCKGNTQLF